MIDKLLEKRISEDNEEFEGYMPVAEFSFTCKNTFCA